MQRLARSSHKKSKKSKKNKLRGKSYPTAGRPKHVPTKRLRRKVRRMSAAGYGQPLIADCIGISEPILRKYYRKELDFARMELVSNATGVVAHGLKNKEAWAACFVLKTLAKSMGWSERTEITGANGKDLFADLDLTRLDDAQFTQLKQLLSSAGMKL